MCRAGYLPPAVVGAVGGGQSRWRKQANSDFSGHADCLRRRIGAELPGGVVVDDPVDDMVQRVDRVVIRGEPEGGLGLTIGDHALDRQPRKRIEPARVTEALDRLRKDVPGQHVPGLVELTAVGRIRVGCGEAQTAIARRTPGS